MGFSFAQLLNCENTDVSMFAFESSYLCIFARYLTEKEQRERVLAGKGDREKKTKKKIEGEGNNKREQERIKKRRREKRINDHARKNCGKQ